MTISDAAQRNHDELFPGHVSTLKVTDPELIEVFDNFAFDEVLRHGDLDTRTRLMVQLAAMIACQAINEYRVMLGAALTVGVTPVEVKEIVYQAVPYVGLAKVFDFLHATNEVLTERGVELPLPPQSTSPPRRGWTVGLAVQKQIVGAEWSTACTPPPRTTSRTSSATCPANCFGDYVARSGLDLRTRELLTFAMLVALGGCDAQVKGHVAAQPQRRQRPGHTAQRPHAALAVHRLPPHPQWPGAQRGRSAPERRRTDAHAPGSSPA